MSELNTIEFNTPSKAEFWGRYLPKAFLPYFLLLLLIPAYKQIHSLFIFTPMIVIFVYQLVLFFRIRKSYNSYIERISYDAINQRLHIERFKNDEKERIDLPYQSFNIHITIIPYFSVFSYFDIYKIQPNKKVLRQFFCGKWNKKTVYKHLKPYANACKEVLLKDR